MFEFSLIKSDSGLIETKTSSLTQVIESLYFYKKDSEIIYLY